MSGPCRGDSGGGLFVRQGNSYFLKGLISASLLNQGTCDVTNFALYTNVDMFSSWIRNPSEDLTSSEPALPPAYVPSTTRAPARPSYIVNPAPSYSSYQPAPNPGPSYSSYQPAPPSYSSNQSSKPQCGIMNQPSSLIQGGSPSTREAFPWTVAILVRQSQGGYAYFSTGTLISNKHIITTGLSVANVDSFERYNARSSSDFRLYFGINDMTQPNVAGSSFVDGVARVVLHPNIKHGFPRIANVGILVLKSPVQFSSVIYPVCLPDGAIDFDEADGRNAVAVGWGQDDTGADSSVKNFASIKIRSQNDCESFWSDYLRRGGSSKFFCAGGIGRKSACYRDQPLYIKNDGIWFLRGLISIALNLPDNTCDYSKPVLYEDVGQYHSWISEQILSSF